MYLLFSGWDRRLSRVFARGAVKIVTPPASIGGSARADAPVQRCATPSIAPIRAVTAGRRGRDRLAMLINGRRDPINQHLL